jgi:hypothetical protein
MVAYYLPPVEPAVEPATASTPPQHPWMIPENQELWQSLLNSDGSVNLCALQEFLWRGISPLALGQQPHSFGRYFLHRLWRRCHMAEEYCAQLCLTLHYMAIFQILKKFAYTGLMPCGIYNLMADESRHRISRQMSITREFEFPEKTVSVNIPTSYLEALIPRVSSVGTLNGPRGCILILAYKYGEEFGVYHYGYKSSGGSVHQMWACLTDVNPLEIAFSGRHHAGQIVHGLITEERDAFRDL